jgi:ribosome recycling factor
MERDHELSEDEHKLWADEIQALTDKHVKTVDELLQHKDAEILQV